MKISSLSPGHHRDPPSTTRRLRPNRSLRGAQSPMFPSSSTKPRGNRPFDNNPAEPSSPKVTCIGQVRVKARKKHIIHNNNNNNNNNNRILQRNLSTNRADANLLQDRNRGEVSFRRVDKNQKWVHFPLTICEALSCLFPCRTPSCLSNTGRENGERERGEEGSCGAVFARWLVAIEGGKREIEEERETGFRRHGVGEIEVEQGRVSICVPPRNALLLMRCRSDPLRVNALANRLWECRERTEEEEDEDEGEREIGLKRKDLIFLGEFDDFEKLGLTEKKSPLKESKEKSGEIEDLEAEKSDIEGGKVREDESGDELSGFSSESVETIAELEFFKTDELEIKETRELGIEATENLLIEKTEVLDIEVTEGSGIGKIEVFEIEEACEPVISQTEESVTGEIEEFEVGEREESLIEKTEESVMKNTEELVEEEERRTSHFSCSSVISLHFDIAEGEAETAEPRLEETEEEEGSEVEEREEREAVLPECLLMMRYEPKLSMEVSKETWICSTDFIRWLPKRRPKLNADYTKKKKRNTTVDADAPLPPRSSCSFPAAPPSTSMAALIEQRLMSAVAYEPFVLTRCKSEPMRTAAAKLVPETCFWNNRKLEPHRSANFAGVNAAGLGF